MRHPCGMALTILFAAPVAWAAHDPHLHGKAVVEQVCERCHGSGLDGAPRIGDHKAWEARAVRGLTRLTESAIAGVRKMPHHGGNPELSDVDLGRAITYMVNQSGGRWTEPIDPARPPAPRDARQVVEGQCVKCHGEGLSGAPRLGDRGAWVARVRQGFDALLHSAIRGHGAMPARGGMAELTDAELRSAIMFMFQSSVNAEGAVINDSRLGSLPVRSGADVVMWRCASCHEKGTGGAPRIADTAAWAPRMQNGLAALVRSAIQGHGAMPARGGMADLTDEEMFAATSYLTGHWAVGRR